MHLQHMQMIDSLRIPFSTLDQLHSGPRDHRDHVLQHHPGAGHAALR